MLAGIWILVLLPLMDVLTAFGWDASVPVPAVFDFKGVVRTLNETLLCETRVYQPVIFCIGVVLLFSKERGRRRSRLDWTRRWGVICSYVVFLLSAVKVFFIGALVLAGIAALFQAMPPKYQPAVTHVFVQVSTGYLRYGAYPSNMSGVVLVAFSSIAILLACVPLFDALRSSSPKRLVVILLIPLALFSLMYLVLAGRCGLGISALNLTGISGYEIYFRPNLLVAEIAGYPLYLTQSRPALDEFFVEATKWSIALGIAVWLSIAQFAAWWQGKKENKASAGINKPDIPAQ